MNTLPSCTILQFPIKEFSRSPSDYSKLLELIQEYVGADCRAFVINDKILYNIYDTSTKTFNNIRDKIIDNAHCVLEEYQHNVDIRIDIYMFPKQYSFKLMIRYYADVQKYIVHRLNSQGYIDKFGEDNEI